MQDHKEILKNLRESMKEEINDTSVDTMVFIEDLNAGRSKDSTRYRDNKKIIFKEHISSKNADELGELVLNNCDKNINGISSYKDEILSKCNSIYIQGENPIEMLVYSTKGLAGDTQRINAIRDVIKTFYEDHSEYVVIAYKNILKSWNWNDCLELVLMSITELRIYQLAKDIYEVFVNNNIVRELAAKTIISLESTDIFKDIINFLCTLENKSTNEIDKLRNILYSMAKFNNKNTLYIYECYMQLTVDKNVGSILIGAIRFNIDNAILDDVDKKLKDSQLSYHTFRKLITLLSRSKQSNKNIANVLIDSLRYSHFDDRQKSLIKSAIGQDAPELQMEIIRDRSKSKIERREAILSMARTEDNNYLQIIDEVSKESDQFKAVVSAVKVERGNMSHVIKLFEYIVTRDENDEVAIEATHQIRRLRTLRDENLNGTLLKVASSLLADDEISNIKKVDMILDIFSTGVPTDDIGKLFLNKLKSTKHKMIKVKIIDFYRKEFNRLKSDTLKKSIKDAILECTYEAEVSSIAMKCLKSMTSYDEITPTLREME